MSRVQEFTERVPANSGAFDELVYDAPTKRVFAKFHSGTVIGYRDMESSTWEAWKGADSKHRFWKLFVQPNYGGVDGDVEFVERKSEPVATPASQPAKDVETEQSPGTETFTVVLRVEADSLVQAATRFANEDGVSVVSVTGL